MSHLACGENIPERRWLEPMPLQEATPAGAPTLAANSRGDVVAAWMQGTGNDLGVWSRRLVAGSWTSADLVEAGHMYWEPPQLVLNEGGVSFGLWSVRSPFPYGWLRGARSLGGRWETPQPLNDGTQDSSSTARLGVLGPEGASATWKTLRSIDGTESLQWSRFDPMSGWSTPVTLGPAVSGPDSPKCWSDETGRAFVLWRRPFGGWVARYLSPQDGWGPELPMPAAADKRYGGPTIAVRPNGAVEVLWREGAFGTGVFVYERIWANRLAPGSGWTDLVALDTTARLGCQTALVADARGSLAVWGCRTDPDDFDLQGTWYSELPSRGSWTAARPLAPLPASAVFIHLAGDGLGNSLAVWSVNGPSAEVWAASSSRGAGWDAPTVIARSSRAMSVADLRLLPSGEGLATWVEGEAAYQQQMRSAQYAHPRWLQPQDASPIRERVVFSHIQAVQTTSGDVVLVWAENNATPLPPNGYVFSPSSLWSNRFVAQ